MLPRIKLTDVLRELLDLLLLWALYPECPAPLLSVAHSFTDLPLRC